MHGLGTAPFPGPGQHSALVGAFTILSHLSPSHQSLHPELCPSHGSRSCRQGCAGVREILHTAGGSLWDKPSPGGRCFSVLPNGLVHDDPLETLHQPCPKGPSQGSQLLLKTRMLLLAGHQGLISSHSSTARAALEACMAQEVKGSESWPDPNPDGERWPHEWRKLFTAWNCEQHRLHALGLQLASPDTEGLGLFFFSRTQTEILGSISGLDVSSRSTWRKSVVGCLEHQLSVFPLHSLQVKLKIK